VLAQLRGDVDVGQHVAVEHQEAVLEQVLGVLQRAGRAARLGLDDVAQAQAERLALAEGLADLRRLEAAAQDDVVDPVPAQPFEHVHQERPVDERDDRLGLPRRQRPQARALPTDEDHRLHYRRPTPS
jgi:hypothetical protein